MIHNNKNTVPTRVPVRSLILNVSPYLHDIPMQHRQDILRELKRNLRRAPLMGGRVVEGAKGVSIVWAWGDCTEKDTDLSSPAEVSGILAAYTGKQSRTPDGAGENVLHNRTTEPVFKEAIAKAVSMVQVVLQVCEDLSIKPHNNAAPSWQERFGLKHPLTCRFGICHGKLFNVGDGLSGLSLDVAADMARMAPKSGLTCGPIVMHVLEELLAEPGAISGLEGRKKPHLHSLDMQLIPSAQIECPLWEVKF